MSLDPQIGRPPEQAEAPVHPVNAVLRPDKLLLFGLQHLFIMYAGAVAVPLIVGPAVGLGSRDIAVSEGAVAAGLPGEYPQAAGLPARPASGRPAELVGDAAAEASGGRPQG